MKELSIAGKATRYDQAIKVAKSKIKNDKDHVLYEDDVIEIFPELAESEDEKIRKAILKWLSNFNAYDKIRKAILKWLSNFNAYDKIFDSFEYEKINIIEWLEKQGEQKLYVNDNAKEMFIKALERVEEQNNKGYKLTDCDKNSWWEDFKTYCGYTEIQNPADKVEPKFCEGEWITIKE